MTENANELENVINSVDYAYDQDYFYFEQYYDDKYGKDRAISLLSFDVEWKKVKEEIKQLKQITQRINKRIPEIETGEEYGTCSNIIIKELQQLLKDDT